jgi:Domain of unknown function (DUF6894)
MPRYFYHMQMHDDLFPDAIGREEPDLSAAHAHAVTLARTIMWYCEADELTESTAPWIVRVANDGGRRVLSVIVPYRRERPTSSAVFRRTNTNHSALTSVFSTQGA